MKKRLCIVLIIFFVFTSGCVKETTRQTQSSQRDKLRVAVLPADNSALVLTAKEKGFFKTNGLDVTLVEYPYGLPTLHALSADEVDVGLPAEFAFVGESFKKDNLRIIATGPHENVMVIVARRDKGINKPSDLVGKKIAVTRKTQGEFNLGKFLTLNGVMSSEVELIDLKPAESVEAIKEGRVDALLTWNQFVYQSQQALGENAVSWDSQAGQDIYLLHVTTAEKLSENPGVYKRFVRSILQAADYIKAHPQESKELVLSNFDIEREYLNSHWPRVKFEVNLPQELILAMEDEARWGVKNNLTDANEIPNYLNYIHTETLRDVEPEAVSIIS